MKASTRYLTTSMTWERSCKVFVMALDVWQGYRSIWYTLQLRGMRVPHIAVVTRNSLRIDPKGSEARKAHRLKNRIQEVQQPSFPSIWNKTTENFQHCILHSEGKIIGSERQHAKFTCMCISVPLQPERWRCNSTVLKSACFGYQLKPLHDCSICSK